MSVATIATPDLDTIISRLMPSPVLPAEGNDDSTLPPLTIDQFWSWLSTKDDGFCVGYAESTRTCPIAQFYQEYHDLKVWVSGAIVNLSGVSPSVGERSTCGRWLPKWGEKFVSKVDTGLLRGRPITAREARSIFLESVKRAMKDRVVQEWVA